MYSAPLARSEGCSSLLKTTALEMGWWEEKCRWGPVLAMFSLQLTSGTEPRGGRALESLLTWPLGCTALCGAVAGQGGSTLATIWGRGYTCKYKTGD